MDDFDLGRAVWWVLTSTKVQKMTQKLVSKKVQILTLQQYKYWRKNYYKVQILTHLANAATYIYIYIYIYTYIHTYIHKQLTYADVFNIIYMYIYIYIYIYTYIQELTSAPNHSAYCRHDTIHIHLRHLLPGTHFTCLLVQKYKNWRVSITSTKVQILVFVSQCTNTDAQILMRQQLLWYNSTNTDTTRDTYLFMCIASCHYG